MENVIDALLVVRRNRNTGEWRLGLKVTDSDGVVAWANRKGYRKFQGAIGIRNNGVEAMIRRSEDDRFTHEATINGTEFVGWAKEKKEDEEKSGTNVSFSLKSQQEDLVPESIDEII